MSGLTVEERFWSKVAVGEDDECWPWKAYKTPDGYGYFYFEGRLHTSPSVAMLLSGMDVDEGLGACHTCDNPPCCNPGHLFGGTQRDNMLDCSAKGRMGLRTCKTTEEEVREIRRLRGQGWTYRRLSQRFRLNPGRLHDIVTYKRWGHIT